MSDRNIPSKEQVWIPVERVGQIEVREYVHGDQARHTISISEADLKLPTLVGGFVARNPDNHADQWYIARDYFNKHYRIPVETEAVRGDVRSWMPAWLREFHCQCEPTGEGSGQCVACQAADLIAGKHPETTVTTGDSNARQASLAGNSADTSNVEPGNLSGAGRDEVSRGDRQQSVSHAERMFRSHPKASDLADLIRSRLFQTFLGQGFWHAHHVDLIWRYNGQDVREEADWLKDVWYVMRGAEKASEPTTCDTKCFGWPRCECGRRMP